MTTVTAAAARVIAETFFEAIAAPDYEPDALNVFASKKNLRVMRVHSSQTGGERLDLRVISDNGLLIQDRDLGTLDERKLRVVSVRQPTDEEMRALRFAWILAKHVKSNAIVYASDGQLVGVGAGQMAKLVNNALTPFIADSKCLSVEGPTANIPARLTLPFALLLHELCTNASKAPVA
jgi:phosphoribosylaminoimidazolecarboxamide formyltransferase/IMP cyclohydrolase